tara:strand:- start:377 stop:499 length:123 start_codon:yes stop_codon:yes gene_type:complete
MLIRERKERDPNLYAYRAKVDGMFVCFNTNKLKEMEIEKE